MPQRDVVVLLPGISGSVLSKDGKDIWGTSAGAILRALGSGGGSIRTLRLADDDPDRDDLGDGVTATRLIPDLHMIPGFWKIDGYTKVARTLVSDLELVPGQNYFEFAYDWRRDNKVAARRLARQTHDWLRAWRERSGNADAKLILIGHSMGGLVARYFIECMEGWRSTRLLLTFGTPYRGSLSALGFLVNGFSKKIGPLRLDFSDVLRTFTAVYQLLPTFPCVDNGTGTLARVAELDDLPNLDVAKARDAAAFHREIKESQASNAAMESYRSAGPKVYPIIGIRQPTLLSAARTDTGLDLLHTLDGDDYGGDGTVPRASAIPHELDGTPAGMFLADAHASLQNANSALEQIFGAITGLEVPTEMFRDQVIELSLDIDDIYPALEPGIFRVRPSRGKPSLHADISNTATGQQVARIALQPRPDGWQEGRFTLPDGTYRLTAGGTANVRPVTDCFGVIEGGDG
jgi:pimeloyl-ACP methyl ester carboxylesterase